MESQLPSLPSQGGVDRKLIGRVLRHLLSTDDQENARKKAFTQGSTAAFIHICSLARIEHSEIDLGRRTAKRQLFEKIISKVRPSSSSIIDLLLYIINRILD